MAEAEGVEYQTVMRSRWGGFARGASPEGGYANLLRDSGFRQDIPKSCYGVCPACIRRVSGVYPVCLGSDCLAKPGPGHRQCKSLRIWLGNPGRMREGGRIRESLARTHSAASPFVSRPMDQGRSGMPSCRLCRGFVNANAPAWPHDPRLTVEEGVSNFIAQELSVLAPELAFGGFCCGPIPEPRTSSRQCGQLRSD
jgi:hypothetical protein